MPADASASGEPSSCMRQVSRVTETGTHELAPGERFADRSPGAEVVRQAVERRWLVEGALDEDPEQLGHGHVQIDGT